METTHINLGTKNELTTTEISVAVAEITDRLARYFSALKEINFDNRLRAVCRGLKLPMNTPIEDPRMERAFSIAEEMSIDIESIRARYDIPDGVALCEFAEKANEFGPVAAYTPF